MTSLNDRQKRSITARISNRSATDRPRAEGQENPSYTKQREITSCMCFTPRASVDRVVRIQGGKPFRKGIRFDPNFRHVIRDANGGQTRIRDPLHEWQSIIQVPTRIFSGTENEALKQPVPRPATRTE